MTTIRRRNILIQNAISQSKMRFPVQSENFMTTISLLSFRLGPSNQWQILKSAPYSINRALYATKRAPYLIPKNPYGPRRKEKSLLFWKRAFQKRAFFFSCLRRAFSSKAGSFFWERSQSRLKFKTEQFWCKLLRYELVDPTIKISLYISEIDC